MNGTFKKLIALVLIAAMLFSLGFEAFAESLRLPAALKEVGEESFFGDESLDEVVVPYGATLIGPRAFAYSGMKRIDIPDTVTEIAEDAFEGLSDDFAICAPKYSYAYEYAINRHIRWIDPAPKEREDIVILLDDEIWYEEDADITLDEFTFEPLPTDGVTDPEELSLIQEFNRLQTESAATNEDMIQLRDSFVDATDDYKAFLEEESFVLDEDGYAFSSNAGSYSISPEVLDTFDEGSELLESKALENGSLIMKLKNRDDSISFLEMDPGGLHPATAADVQTFEGLEDAELRLSQNETFYAANTQNIRDQLEIIRSGLEKVGSFASEVEEFISGMLEKAEEAAKLASKKMEIARELERKYPNGNYSGHAMRYDYEYELRLRTVSGFRGLSRTWAKLNLLTSINGVVSDCETFMDLSEILLHHHPTAEDRKDVSTLLSARQLQNKATLAEALLLARLGYGIWDVVSGMQNVLSLLSIAAGPAGVGVSLGVKAALSVVKASIQKIWKKSVLQAAADKGLDTLCASVIGLDKALHDPESMGKVSGTIYDASTGAPLAGVSLTYGYCTAVTDGKGHYEMTAPYGSGKLWMEKAGYTKNGLVLTVSKEKTVCSGRLSPREPVPPASIAGVVTDSETGELLPDVKVTLETPNNTSFTAYTDADGAYSFSDVPLDVTLKLIFEKENYYRYSTSIYVSAGKTGKRCDVQMEPNPISEGFDPDFWKWCVSKYDSDNDGTLSVFEITSVWNMDCSGKGFTSINGIQNFRNLVSLNCSNNRLTSLDVYGCFNLNSLYCENNQLTSLNLAGCTELDRLYCSNNRFTSLNLSVCSKLRELNCGNNQLTGLFLYKFKKLEWLDCIDNRLVWLELSECDSLKKLVCSQNQLKSLNVLDCSRLVDLYCDDNQLESLDVSCHGFLSKLFCENNRLESLNVTYCEALRVLSCDNNQLTELSVYECEELKHLDCFNNQLTDIDVSGCTKLETLYCQNNRLTSLDATDCSALDELKLHNNPLHYLCISGCSALIDVDLSSIHTLTDLNATGCSALKWLGCQNNQLTSLDLSGCSRLEILYCQNNLLTSLDASGCSALVWLYCYNNRLTSLNLSACSTLTELYCYNNLLTSLDLSGYTALKWLYCYDNELTSLNLSACSTLSELRCSGNQLTSLNLSACHSLRVLWCYGNRLAQLNFSGHPTLTALHCGNNQLTSLNVAGCSKLSYLYCSYNQLTSLNVAGCSRLSELRCSGNRLTSLDLSNCSVPQKLSFDPGIAIYS